MPFRASSGFRYYGSRLPDSPCKAMNETQRLFDTLKRCLRSKGVTYGGLARKLSLSESSVKRLFAKGSFSVDRLERVCRAIDMSIADLVRLSSGQSTAAPDKDFTLTLEQERILAGNPSLLAFFYLLLNGHPPDAVAERLGLSKRAVANFLSRLVACSLCEASNRKQVNLNARLPIAWRPDGPVRKLYERQVRSEFLQGEFAAKHEALNFHSAELSPASIRILMRKMDRLSADFADLAVLDVGLPSREKMSVAMLLASRPWVFSMFSAYRPRR